MNTELRIAMLSEGADADGASAEPRVITDVIFGPHEHDYFYDHHMDALWTVGVPGVNEELAADLHTLLGAKLDTPTGVRSCRPGAPVAPGRP